MYNQTPVAEGVMQVPLFVNTDHSVKAVLHRVLTIVRQGKTEHMLKHNMEAFFNSDSMPLSSHIQFT